MVRIIIKLFQARTERIEQLENDLNLAERVRMLPPFLFHLLETKPSFSDGT